MKFLVSFGVLALVSYSQQYKLCDVNPAATVGPNDPRLPQALPPTFQVTVEATIIDRGLSLSAVEYFDQNSGRSALLYRQNGQMESIYVNVNTNESYHIVGDNCTVYNQAADFDDVFIGGQSRGSKVPHSYSTAAALRFAQKYGEVYAGPTVIRGIQVDHWQSCMYWGYVGVNFTLDYYFSASNWSTADGSFQLPVRAVVQGYINDLGPGPGSSFHHIYDYVGFKSSIDDVTLLETPKGVVCPGRKHTRAMPQLQQQYQYREEITVPGQLSVMNIDVWYDYSYKLIRYDYRPTSLTYPYYSLDDISEIHDYNTGVAYIIDQTFLNCTIVPIENSTWDATRNVTANHVAIGMKRPENLFYLDPTYAYSGQRKARGINCDVFTTIRTDYSDNGLLGKNVMFDVYFMDKGWTSDNDIGANTRSTDTPVQLEISEPTTGYYIKYDFFDFDQEHPFLSSFDITQCYTDQNEIRFQITFPGNFNLFLLQYKSLLEQFSLLALAQTALVSPLRLQKIDVHWDTQHAYLLGTLMDISPPLAKFRRWPKLVASYSDDVIFNISSANVCAASCSIQTQAVCNSFDICPKADTCALSLHYTSDGKELHASDTCDHFSRVISSKPALEVGLTQAFTLLSNAVNSGTFKIPINVPILGVNSVFAATSIKQISYGPASNAPTGTPSGSQKPQTNPSSKPATGTNQQHQSTKTPNSGTPSGSQKPQTNPSSKPATGTNQQHQSTKTPNSAAPPGSQKPQTNLSSKPATGTNQQHQSTKRPNSATPSPGPLCTNNGKSSSNTGVIVGVALAMLALGLLLGVAAMVLYQKRQENKTSYDVSYIKNPNYEKSS